MTRIVELAELQKIFNQTEIIESVRQGFIDHAAGKVITPPPGQLNFNNPPGGCCVKIGSHKDGPFFVIKVATAFHHNSDLGLPVNSGMVLLMDSQTGMPLVIFKDQGWLTSWRTAAAGVLALEAGSLSKHESLGIIGAGHQAYEQAIWNCKHFAINNVVMQSRNINKAQTCADALKKTGLNVSVVSTTSELLALSNIVITCTPSTSPLIMSTDVKPGTHIIAMGADTPGKQELDAELFKRADIIITDDHNQCINLSDFGMAIRAGHSDLIDKDISLGAVLDKQHSGRDSDKQISVVDLTGIAAQDLAIATWAFENLS